MFDNYCGQRLINLLVPRRMRRDNYLPSGCVDDDKEARDTMYFSLTDAARLLQMLLKMKEGVELMCVLREHNGLLSAALRESARWVTAARNCGRCQAG